ncbi:hypothetical protein DM02DRAFT_236986 [Periconia macrospinosa]|uniref:SPX domain-containing protein n=1 Tax=Periconia macrospinosa TaxID=97972 RepID=A0A2V1EES4_9PLEO|nr:hypothetical protein DM02DRAFT_236986 [Periconia macrospinosa]
MKYGDTLRQRSIPAWGHFNIDYDYLKDLIKHHTTAGTGRAVSIPGQGATSERAFSDTFLRALKAQHDRITLFIRSKSGEIERRLEHIAKSLEPLKSHRVSKGHNGRLPARVVERYAKIDADVTKTGEEIQSLSRFRVAQRTGFRKILKKYRRWTRDRDAERRFKNEVTRSSDSFYQLDLGYLLDQYIHVLGALRANFDTLGAPRLPINNAKASTSLLEFAKATHAGTDVDFDLALSLTPLGTSGTKATYWIHPDHVVEAKVLLLQHMGLFSRPNTATDNHSPERYFQRPTSSTNNDGHYGNKNDAGLLVLDHPELFAIKQNASTIGGIEETAGTLQIKAAGNARWTSSGDAAVVVNLDSKATKEPLIARLKRKQLAEFFDTYPPLHRQQDISLQHEQEQGANSAEDDGIDATREWLKNHDQVRPIAGICSERTRFVGLHNNHSGGMWAILDEDIFMKSTLHKDLGDDDWPAGAREGSIAFPHAVLQIRREGTHAATLIQTLDRSHLVERARGFSLEAHAVWACCKPDAMSPPVWMSLLDQDIRKLPPAIKRQRRKGSSTHGSVAHLSPPQTSTSANSPTDGFSSPLHYGESSATSAPEFVEPPPLQAFRKKRKPSAYYPPTTQFEAEGQRYWNEYDNPESEDEGYYIYIDPDAPVKFPGQEFIEAIATKARQLFGIPEAPEEGSVTDSVESSDDEMGDESAAVVAAQDYGTFSPKHDAPQHQGYFNGLFRTLRGPQREALIHQENVRERRTLLSELQVHQHKTEMTKARFYSMCIVVASVINIMLSVMTLTSRKKERGVVDFAVLFGTAFNLVLCAIALITMQTRRERLGWVHQGLVGVFVVGNLVADFLLVRWVFGV